MEGHPQAASDQGAIVGLMVSVSCTTFNQERYIAQALDGILMQETDFDIEVLVHDDASTDGTTEIIREYERQHPGLIKPIYQSENQYSKGVKIWPLNDARALGKYIALCEGDDYWTDPSKLQRQVDLMEADPLCALSVHSSLKVSPAGEPIGEMRAADHDSTLSLDEILAERKEFATASMMFPARFYSELPDYFFRAPVGDRPLTLYLATRGSVRYMDRQMSAYRTQAVNSWTLAIRESMAMRVDYNRRMAEMFRSFDQSTGLAHHASLQLLIDWHEFTVAQLEGKYAEVKSPKYSRFYKELGLRYRMVLTLRKRAPGLASLFSRVKCLFFRLVDRN